MNYVVCQGIVLLWNGDLLLQQADRFRWENSCCCFLSYSLKKAVCSEPACLGYEGRWPSRAFLYRVHALSSHGQWLNAQIGKKNAQAIYTPDFTHSRVHVECCALLL